MYCFFLKYRYEGFTSSMTVTKDIATNMNVESIIPTKHCVIRKKQFDENN